MFDNKVILDRFFKLIVNLGRLFIGFKYPIHIKVFIFKAILFCLNGKDSCFSIFFIFRHVIDIHSEFKFTRLLHFDWKNMNLIVTSISSFKIFSLQFSKIRLWLWSFFSGSTSFTDDELLKFFLNCFPRHPN